LYGSRSRELPARDRRSVNITDDVEDITGTARRPPSGNLSRQDLIRYRKPGRQTAAEAADYAADLRLDRRLPG
jgi:hypothetical protein